MQLLGHQDWRLDQSDDQELTHLRPIVAVLEFAQIHRPKSPKEILDELILGSLRQSHAQQFEVFRCRPLSDIVGKTKITRETDLKVLPGKPVKPPVIQTVHPQCNDRLSLVTFRAQCGNELSRQVLIQQNFHVG